MGTIIFIIIAVVVVIAILASRNKQTTTSTSESSTDKYISIMKDELNEKKNELLQEMVQIGVDALTSLEMTKDEKEDIIGQTIDFIRENAQNQEEEKELVFQIMQESYAALLDKFSFNESFCAELSNKFENFEKGIRNNTLETYGWSELIEMVEKEKEKTHNAYVDKLKYSDTLSFALKGLNYRNEEEQEAAEDLEEGDDLILESEPTNEYDPLAIKVLTVDGFHIGYVEATKCKFISENMHRLLKCRIKQISHYENLYIYGLAYFE